MGGCTTEFCMNEISVAGADSGAGRLGPDIPGGPMTTHESRAS